MTAEVVIANSGAVALAADSAVTIGEQKIYNSALKVFALSKVEPVGIMVYGNAGLLGVPWEPIIKTYRAELKAKKFPEVAGYAEHFLKSLPTRLDCFPQSVQDSWLKANVRGYYQLIKEALEEGVQDIFKAKGAITEAESNELFREVVARHHQQLGKRDFLGGYSAASEKAFRKRYLKAFRELSREVFQNVKIAPATAAKLYDIATRTQTRDIFSNATSGVVFAGFGSEEIYPSTACYQVDGISGGKLKAKFVTEKSFSVTGPGQCVITPFAQEDMVYTFMRGMNPAVHSFVVKYLRQMCRRFPELIDDAALAGSKQAKRKIKQDLKDDAAKLFRKFLEQLDAHTNQEHIAPIMEMVGVLPKDELAAMAESLVNLTAFKRKMTDNLETVGGPIDVAVISKGDGLVWVKRKHYFPEELNQHFFANYFHDVYA